MMLMPGRLVRRSPNRPDSGGVSLLRPAEDGDEYRQSIAFEDRASQQQWVNANLHEAVWPSMEDHCLTYSVKNYYEV
jgi:heme-degrading monooxygenase HmoA